MPLGTGRKRIILVLAVGVAALTIYGFVIGAVGSVFFGDGKGFLPTPEVHLPPEPVLSSDAAVVEETGKLPNRFVITNTLLSSWITTIVLVALFFFATRRMDPGKAPKGLQNFMELIISVMYDFVEGVAGKETTRRFFPLIATIFLFVLVNAWLGLLPIYPSLGFLNAEGHITRHLLRPAGTDLNMPLALALISFVIVEFNGVKALRFHYFGKFIRLGSLLRVRSIGSLFNAVIDIFVGMLELLSELVRLVSLTFRLWGNMTAGEILLLIIAFIVPFVISVIFYGLELLVGLIQGLIFASLTLVFVMTAIAPHESGEEHH